MTSVVEMRADLEAAYAEVSRLRKALTTVRALEAMLTPPVHVLHPDNDLTSREYETLGYLRQGLGNKDIANKMCVTTSTVRTHVLHLFAKMHVHTSAEAAITGIRLELNLEEMTRP
jgi:DNA-binding NarL/FixJ family response regulator